MQKLIFPLRPESGRKWLNSSYGKEYLKLPNSIQNDRKLPVVLSVIETYYQNPNNFSVLLDFHSKTNFYKANKQNNYSASTKYLANLIHLFILCIGKSIMFSSTFIKQIFRAGQQAITNLNFSLETARD